MEESLSTYLMYRKHLTDEALAKAPRGCLIIALVILFFPLGALLLFLPKELTSIQKKQLNDQLKEKFPKIHAENNII
jgi:hypothetical protein